MDPLYMLVYVGGLLIATIGPLPYDVAECEVRAAERWSDIDPNVVLLDQYTRDDAEFLCERYAERPKLDPVPSMDPA